MATNEIRIVQAICEHEEKYGVKSVELWNYCNIAYYDDYCKALQFLIDINMIKKIQRQGKYYYYLLNRTCPLVMKIREGLRNSPIE